MIDRDMPDAVRIPLNDGHEAIVDRRDLELVSGYTWRVLEGHNGKRYAYAGGSDGPYYMHRIVAGTPKGMETDHINGDGLDNRRTNLRVATPSQNSSNTGKISPRKGRVHSSEFKGVHWDSSREKWKAEIKAHYTPRTIGRFDTEEDAARAYDRAAIEAWGEFAFTNYPRQEYAA